MFISKKSTIKVLHIIVNLSRGGAELSLKRLIEADPENYPNTIVISLISIGDVGQSLLDIGVRVHSLGMSSFLNAPVALWRLVRLIRWYRPKIVQTWMYHADLFGGIAAHLAGVHRVVWGIRTTDTKNQGYSLSIIIIRWLCARFSRWIPSIIVCAANASKDSHIKIGYKESKFIVIPNGFNLEPFDSAKEHRDEIREMLGIGDDFFIIGSVGRFDLDKDHYNFISAAKILVTKYPALKFLMIGNKIDEKNDKLMRWINDTGHREHFKLLGEKDNIINYLAAMDIFCMHSRNEGFPNALAEAMAMGLPCVATDVGDSKILLDTTGVLVPKQNYLELSRGIDKLLSLDSNTRLGLGISAKYRVSTHYSIIQMRDNFDKLYFKIISQ